MITFIKILTWLASPIGLLTWLSLIALGLRLLNQAPRTRLLLTIMAIGQLLLFAWPPVSTELIENLESKARSLQAHNTGGPYVAILLLGGGISPGIPGVKTANAHEAFDRIIHAARLYHDGLAPRVIVCGGTALRDHYPSAQSEAAAMKDMLILMGLPASAIITEDQSLTTRQNMSLTAEILKNQAISGRLALVTSATHMPRAAATAQRASLEIDAFPTDWTEPRALRPIAMRWLPNAQALEESERALKEWLALFANY